MVLGVAWCAKMQKDVTPFRFYQICHSFGGGTGTLDQSSRYADLTRDEYELIKNGKHVLVAYIMKHKAGYEYLATAAHFAAESSTCMNVNVCTTDDFTKSVDALVYYLDPDKEEMKIACPTMLFDRSITDGRAMMCSILTVTIGKTKAFDGPSCSVVDMWRIIGRGTKDGGLAVCTIIKPKWACNQSLSVRLAMHFGWVETSSKR